ncbi:MAG TPA: nuclear transport factor 2 family protein [Sphingomicrobium sp.]
MAELSPVIETLENRYMRAWIGRDFKELKALTARSFTLIVGTRPAMLLDQPSWLAAAGSRWDCSSYRFGDIHVRRIGAFAAFATQAEVKSTLDGADWSGTLWLTDLWRKRRIGGWRLAHRSVSRIEDNPKIAGAVKALQLWR